MQLLPQTKKMMPHSQSVREEEQTKDLTSWLKKDAHSKTQTIMPVNSHFKGTNHLNIQKDVLPAISENQNENASSSYQGYSMRNLLSSILLGASNTQLGQTVTR